MDWNRIEGNWKEVKGQVKVTKREPRKQQVDGVVDEDGGRALVVDGPGLGRLKLC